MLENYALNADNVGFQIKKDIFYYDKTYIESRYNTYGELNNRMSHLRLGYIVGSLGFIPNSILDVGYGNGSFLDTCKHIIKDCYGSDISGYPVPEGVKFTKDWVNQEVDVITMFDVLEHLNDPYILKNIKAKYIAISLPWWHNWSDEWFTDWKHRRENEHLWFFNAENIRNFANTIGFSVMNYSNIEDVIRKSTNEHPNILTVILQR